MGSEAKKHMNSPTPLVSAVLLLIPLAACDMDDFVSLSEGPRYVWVEKGLPAGKPDGATDEVSRAGYAFAKEVKGERWGDFDAMLFTDSTMQDTIARTYATYLRGTAPGSAQPRPGAPGIEVVQVDGDSWRVAAAKAPPAAAEPSAPPSPPRPSIDASAKFACGKMIRAFDDANKGILTMGELRDRVKDAYEDAEVSESPGIESSAERVLAAVTSVDPDAFAAASMDMMRACAGEPLESTPAE